MVRAFFAASNFASEVGNPAKLQHWRAFQAEMPPKAAPVLEFGI
jgi:hypothetical protein